MKKILLISLMLVVYRAASAQIIIALLFGNKLNTEKLEFGLLTGPGFSNVSDMNANARTGFNLGLYFNIKMSQNFFLHPEAIPKEALGAEGLTPYPTGNSDLDGLFADGSVTRKIKAIGLPLLVRYRIKGFLFAEGGPQIDWQLHTKDEFKADVNDNPLTYVKKVDEEVTNFSVGLDGGLVYKFRKDKGIGLGLRYCYGLTDVMKSIDGTQANRVWLLYVSIPVGTGKSTSNPK
jgi:hypothetical protein